MPAIDRAQPQYAIQGTSMESANDMKAHSKTYSSFIAMLKWVLPLLAVITLLIVIAISG